LDVNNDLPITTLGIIKINLRINNNFYHDTIFHVVHDKFPKVVSGILGTSFFINIDVTLNLNKGEMIIITEKNKVNVICFPLISNNIVPIKFKDEQLNNNDIIIEKNNITDTLWVGITFSTCTIIWYTRTSRTLSTFLRIV